MPSCVFTRTQVLRSLSDEAACQEAEAIPDFIYFFLRDVFLAVDEDGDGYVTGESVSRLFPALAPLRATASSASRSAAPGLKTPKVHPTWWSPTSYVSPARCAAAVPQRPLDLCSFMQTYWPIVSDKMAHLVGDTWSQRSSDSRSKSVSDSPLPCTSTGRRPVFSASPFRAVSASPLPPQPTSPLAISVTDECALLSSVCGTTPLPRRETVVPEQHDLYRKTLQYMWMSDDPSTSSHARMPLPDSALPSMPLPTTPPCPKRLLMDSDIEELLIAFSYIDRCQSGYVGVTDVAAALQALLHTAGCADQKTVPSVSPAGINDEVLRLANEMVRVALSLTPRKGANIPPATTTTERHSSSHPSAVSSVFHGGQCVSCTVFARSFQCDTGALPAELIAWCAGCARTNFEPPVRGLSTLPQWMSPVECAFVQQLLISYAELLWAGGSNVSYPCSAGLGKIHSPSAAALSESLSVNINTKKPTSKVCPSAGPRNDDRHDLYACPTRRTVADLQEWCHHKRTALHHSMTNDMTTLPLALLEKCLRQDVHAHLFPEVFSFSAAVGALFETVMEHHVQAVCALAQHTSLCPGSAPSSEIKKTTGGLGPCADGEHCRGSEHVNMNRLVEVITTDPRCLHLRVLVPLDSRLAAVVDAAKHHPRRLVEDSLGILSKCVHGARPSEGSQLTDVLRLRHELFKVSPILARLITGATRLRKGRLCLEECVARLSMHVLSVPPLLRLPFLPAAENTMGPSTPLFIQDDSLTSVCSHPCYTLLRDSRLLMVSHGWLRYACRRMPTRQLQSVVNALRASGRITDGKGCLFGAAADWGGAMLHLGDANRVQQRSISLPDVYSEVLRQVRASCRVFEEDPVLAAHVALALVAASGTTKDAKLEEKTLWWTRVCSLLGQWTATHGGHPASQESTDAWTMDSISRTAVELGLACCQAVSRELCHLRFAAPSTAHVAAVKEEELTQSLTRVVETLSLWAPPPSANLELQSSCAVACARLVDTLVGSCPCLGTSLVDVSFLLRRWLEAYPLPMPLTHLSLCYAVEEVESVYYALKRLAASEESRRRRIQPPIDWPVASPSIAKKGSGSDAANPVKTNLSPAPVLTGISPVCLSELLENEDLVLVLYAISSKKSVGVWGGALSHLSTLLRPVLLSPTGIRIALEKVNAQSSSSEAVGAAATPTSAQHQSRVMTSSNRSGNPFAPEDAIVSMAVPASVQHAMAQLFAEVDGKGLGAVTEDQLRNHRSQVRASVRYGWHRFVTALCSRYPLTSSFSELAPSAASAGDFSASVIHSHRWRCRHRAVMTSLSRSNEAQHEGDISRSSIATKRTDDGVATSYSLGDVLARMSELRVCVQAQLLEESRARAVARATVFIAKRSDLEATRVITGADLSLSTTAGQKSALSSPPTTGTAEWWAKYLDDLCRGYSPLAL